MLQAYPKKPILFRVCEGNRLPGLNQKPMDIGRVTNCLLKHNKYMYLDMEESKQDNDSADGDGFRLLSPKSRFSSDSEEEAQVLNADICVTNLKKLCRGTVQMHQYLKLTRHDQQQKKKIKKAIKQYSSGKRIKTQPILEFELPELPHIKPFTTKESIKDIRDYLEIKNHERLEKRTHQKQKTLLFHHRKMSEFCRQVRRRHTAQKREEHSTRMTKESYHATTGFPLSTVYSRNRCNLQTTSDQLTKDQQQTVIKKNAYH